MAGRKKSSCCADFFTTLGDEDTSKKGSQNRRDGLGLKGRMAAVSEKRRMT